MKPTVCAATVKNAHEIRKCMFFLGSPYSQRSCKQRFTSGGMESLAKLDDPVGTLPAKPRG